MMLKKILLFILMSFILASNAQSKPFKIKIKYESEYGGIYSNKVPTFYAKKGRHLETFKEILNLANKNCTKYSKDTYFFTKLINKRTMVSSIIMINQNGIIQEWGTGYMPDISDSLKWSTNRFYCGNSIEDVLISNSLKYSIFSNEIFPLDNAKQTDRVGDLDTKVFVYKNNALILKKVTDENRKNIALKLKETGKDKISKERAKTGFVKTNIGYKDYSNIISEAKTTCSSLGFNLDTEKFINCIFELSEISDTYEMAKLQEDYLIQKAKTEEDIEMKFTYENKSGQIIEKKESKWIKFWEAVGWVLYEHGDEIFAAAVDAYYGTNNSYASSNSGNTRCVQQRVGNSGVVHTHCSGGVKMYCSSHKVGNQRMVQTICRQR